MHVLFFRPPKGNRESHFAHDARFADTHLCLIISACPGFVLKLNLTKYIVQI